MLSFSLTDVVSEAPNSYSIQGLEALGLSQLVGLFLLMSFVFLSRVIHLLKLPTVPNSSSILGKLFLV